MEIDVELAIKLRGNRSFIVCVRVDFESIVSLLAFQLGLSIDCAVFDIERVVAIAHLDVELRCGQAGKSYAVRAIFQLDLDLPGKASKYGGRGRRIHRSASASDRNGRPRLSNGDGVVAAIALDDQVAVMNLGRNVTGHHLARFQRFDPTYT